MADNQQPKKPAGTKASASGTKKTPAKKTQTASAVGKLAGDVIKAVGDGSTPKKTAQKTSAPKPASGGQTPQRSVKTSDQQKSDLGKFALAAAAVAVSAAASKGKKKGAKRAIMVLTAIILVVVLATGALYYFDVPPLDFMLGGMDTFKYYTYSAGRPPAGAGNAAGSLTVHIIDVGQGDCLFIQFPDGKKMLIDGGENRNAIADGVINYITALYPNESKVAIDIVMLTHTDSDHCGSLDAIIASDKIDALCVYQPRVLSNFENDPLKSRASQYQNVPTITTGVYSSFVQAVYNEMQAGICKEIVYNIQGLTISGTGWHINLYNPAEEMYVKLSTAQNKNDVSPIMALHFNSQVILLTGDSDAKAEENFMKNVAANLFGDGYTGKSDALKVAHHGGKESTSAEFLSYVQPRYALISCGANNKYDHPRPETVSRLSVYTTNIFRTDEFGSIAMTVTGTTFSFKSEKGSIKVQALLFDLAIFEPALLRGLRSGYKFN